MSNQISINLPKNIEKPQFNLFDVVDVQSWSVNDRGVIVGMVYCSPLDTMNTRIKPGWYFNISFLLNRSLKECAALPNDMLPVLHSIHTSDLTLVTPGPAVVKSSRRITIVLLDDIEPPEFSMMDKVEVTLSWRKSITATVVGIEYTPPVNAIAENCSYGWTYGVSYTRGLSMKAVRDLPEELQQANGWVYPDDMKLIQPETTTNQNIFTTETKQMLVAA